MKFRKITSVLLAFIVILSCCVLPVSAIVTSSDGFDYQTIGNSEVEILGLTNGGSLASSTTITIPSSLRANLVTVIGTSALRDNSIVREYILPNTLEEIGNSAFYNSTALKTITIPSKVSEIGIFAFADCTALETVTFNYGYLTSIPSYMFSGCTSLDRVILPSSMGSIADYAFSDCTSLKQIYIPESISRISTNAFKNCSELTIYGVSGSSAHAYAKNNNIPFISLEGVKKSTLNALLISCENILNDADKYSSTGIARLQKVYANALPLKSDYFAVQSQIDTEVANLKSAISALKLNAMSTLEQTVATANSLINGIIYTDSAVANLKSAIASGEALIAVNSKDYSSVINAEQSIKDGINAVYSMTISTLQNKISSYNELITNESYIYMPASIEALSTAIQKAEAILNSSGATNAQYIAEINNLTSVRSSIVYVQKGDINLVGGISSADVVLAERYCVNLIDFNTREQYAADYNNDGRIGLKDVILLQRYLLQFV